MIIGYGELWCRCWRDKSVTTGRLFVSLEWHTAIRSAVSVDLIVGHGLTDNVDPGVVRQVASQVGDDVSGILVGWQVQLEAHAAGASDAKVGPHDRRGRRGARSVGG